MMSQNERAYVKHCFDSIDDGSWRRCRHCGLVQILVKGRGGAPQPRWWVIDRWVAGQDKPLCPKVPHDWGTPIYPTGLVRQTEFRLAPPEAAAPLEPANEIAAYLAMGEELLAPRAAELAELDRLIRDRDQLTRQIESKAPRAAQLRAEIDKIEAARAKVSRK